MENKKHIKIAAEATLSTFELIEKTAAQKLAECGPVSGAVLASGTNGITGNDPVAKLNAISKTNRSGYQALTEEPAISVVVYLDDNGVEHTTYISRSSTVLLPGGTKLAGYGSPIGRLASIPTGEEVAIAVSGKVQTFEILKKIYFNPLKNDEIWDSRDSIFIDEEGRSQSIDSFLQLLGRLKKASEEGILEDLSDLDAYLAGDDNDGITEGIRHTIRQAMALRDQPILDQFQDEIFRMALNSQLIILGPPGTGKTTTLIKRLGQKLNREHLEESEQALIDMRSSGNVPHEQDWIMFTPTDLLKHFVKEAFSREQVPASEQTVKTWDSHKIHLSRNILDILQSGGNKGFIFKPDNTIVKSDIVSNPITWYEAFIQYHNDQLVGYLNNGLSDLMKEADESYEALTKAIEKVAQRATTNELIKTCIDLDKLDSRIEETLKALKAETDILLKKNLAKEFNKDDKFIEELGKHVASITAAQSETDDDLDDDTEEITNAKTPRQKSMAIYNSSIRSIARAHYQRRKLPKNGRPALIALWLGNRLPDADALDRIGHLSAQQNALRRFLRFSSRMIRDLSKNYRSFRRDSFRDKQWYQVLPDKAAHIDGSELDLLILATLRTARQLLKRNEIRNRLDDTGFAKLNIIASQYKNQILVDEATDFSPLQLASMNSLTALETRSFFACGDFNQRITNWGTRSEEQFRWAVPQLNSRPITTVYRQSQRLNEFSRSLLKSTGGNLNYVGQPSEQINHVGVRPVLAEKMVSMTSKANWLAKRIHEVIVSVQSSDSVEQVIPSIAILVRDESEVTPMAEALTEYLEDINLRAVACLKGQSLGEDNDVRVFDVQYIKGLEFEAVFFVDIDHLAEQLPSLFDKYLYVGATRAATYFGITAETTLPERIESIRPHFVDSFGY
ncbi:ATP-binding domain-containing protein [Vibrio harveyi]|uniref:ATP-binding domain-containing protein n=1 Tax=Vibrio harveyi TaxID=669 RepID=UPI00165E3A59|nr:ATP-binding domain-containing protein [Vibrio harveyi]